jgi:hypothetical protein
MTCHHKSKFEERVCEAQAEERAARAVEKLTDEELRQLARKQHGRDGECEIDDGAVVSRGDDAGAYVAAWVWVDVPDEEDDCTT